MAGAAYQTGARASERARATISGNRTSAPSTARYTGNAAAPSVQRGIAARLSALPAKNRLHRAWSRYTVWEMLRNERYRGVLVWNRTKKVRNPETGRKISKSRPESERVRVEVPELRIVPEELWQAVHDMIAHVKDAHGSADCPAPGALICSAGCWPASAPARR